MKTVYLPSSIYLIKTTSTRRTSSAFKMLKIALFCVLIGCLSISAERQQPQLQQRPAQPAVPALQRPAEAARQQPQQQRPVEAARQQPQQQQQPEQKPEQKPEQQAAKQKPAETKQQDDQAAPPADGQDQAPAQGDAAAPPAPDADGSGDQPAPAAPAPDAPQPAPAAPDPAPPAPAADPPPPPPYPYPAPYPYPYPYPPPYPYPLPPEDPPPPPPTPCVQDSDCMAVPGFPYCVNGQCAETPYGKKKRKKAHKFAGEEEGSGNSVEEPGYEADVSSALRETADDEEASGIERAFPHQFQEREPNVLEDPVTEEAEDEQNEEKQSVPDYGPTEAAGNTVAPTNTNDVPASTVPPTNTAATTGTQGTYTPTQPPQGYTTTPSQRISCNTNDDCTHTNLPYCVNGYCSATQNGKKLKGKLRGKKVGRKNKKGSKNFNKQAPQGVAMPDNTQDEAAATAPPPNTEPTPGTQGTNTPTQPSQQQTTPAQPIACQTNDDCAKTTVPFCVNGYCAATQYGKKVKNSGKGKGRKDKESRKNFQQPPPPMGVDPAADEAGATAAPPTNTPPTTGTQGTNTPTQSSNQPTTPAQPIACQTNDDCANTPVPYCVNGYCSATPYGKKKAEKEEKSKGKKKGRKQKKGKKEKKGRKSKKHD